MTDPTTLQDLKIAHDHDWAIALDSQKVHELWEAFKNNLMVIAGQEQSIEILEERIAKLRSVRNEIRTNQIWIEITPGL